MPLANDTPLSRFFSSHWQERLAFIMDLMRELSIHTDPQQLADFYGGRMKQLIQYDRSVSLSRRDLEAPDFRVTRSST